MSPSAAPDVVPPSDPPDAVAARYAPPPPTSSTAAATEATIAGERRRGEPSARPRQEQQRDPDRARRPPSSPAAARGPTSSPPCAASAAPVASPPCSALGTVASAGARPRHRAEPPLSTRRKLRRRRQPRRRKPRLGASAPQASAPRNPRCRRRRLLPGVLLLGGAVGARVVVLGSLGVHRIAPSAAHMSHDPDPTLSKRSVRRVVSRIPFTGDADGTQRGSARFPRRRRSGRRSSIGRRSPISRRSPTSRPAVAPTSAGRSPHGCVTGRRDGTGPRSGAAQCGAIRAQSPSSDARSTSRSAGAGARTSSFVIAAP